MRARNHLGSLAALGLGLVLAACGGGGDDVPAGPDAPTAPEGSFRITTPDITIEAGQEITYCYHTTIQTTRTVGVKKWSSTMTPGSHHLIMFMGSDKPDGTIETDCGFGNGFPLPVWTYSAQTPVQEAMMPAGVGMTIPAGTRVFIQMHYLNTSDEPIQAHVQIDAETYPEAETYTPASAYVTFNTQISIPPNATATAGGQCALPPNVKFFTVSTHAHKQAVHTQVNDGTEIVFQSDNWEHPGAADWRANPNYTFSSGTLTYRCDYDNPTGRTIRTGDSAATDEMCMAVGYFFPADGPLYCINSSTF
jgi:hypothetical protein